MSSRDMATIEEELRDLRNYLHGLPKHLLESGAFVAYQNREALLQEELIAAQLYDIVGVPESARPDQSQGLRQQSTSIFEKLTALQGRLRRRVRLSEVFEWGLPATAAIAGAGASAFIAASVDSTAYLSCGVAVFASLLSAYLRLGESVAEQKQLSHRIEVIKRHLEHYQQSNDLDAEVLKVYRAQMLEFVRELSAEEVGS